MQTFGFELVQALLNPVSDMMIYEKGRETETNLNDT